MEEVTLEEGILEETKFFFMDGSCFVIYYQSTYIPPQELGLSCINELMTVTLCALWNLQYSL